VGLEASGVVGLDDLYENTRDIDIDGMGIWYRGFSIVEFGWNISERSYLHLSKQLCQHT